jgi:hypothetical protein
LILIQALRIDFNARQLSSLHQVHHQVKERDQVVPAATVEELQLVQTSKDQVTAVDLNLFLIDVLLSLFINVSRCETVINKIGRMILENVVISFAKVGVTINTVVQEDIAKIEVVVNVA